MKIKLEYPLLIATIAICSFFTAGTSAADVTGDGVVGVEDAIVSLQVASGANVPVYNGCGSSLDAPDGAPQNAVYVDIEGKVGIGTTTPAALLEVKGDIITTQISVNGSIVLTPKVGSISFGPNDNYRIYSEATTSGLEYHHTNGHRFFGSAGEIIRIKGNGNVGIGTLTPTTKLDVNGAISVAGQKVIDESGNWIGPKLAWALCTYGGLTYSTGAKCKTVSSCSCPASGAAPHEVLTCQADGTWSSSTLNLWAATCSNCPQTCGK